MDRLRVHGDLRRVAMQVMAGARREQRGLSMAMMVMYAILELSWLSHGHAERVGG